MNNTIVIADSGETSRKMISDLLTRRGYRTYQASDGAGAIRHARSIHPHLVIIDVNIWGINAYQAARIIEEDNLSTVIFVTANPDRDFIEKLNSMKVYAYIIKPINSAQLFQMVEFALMNSKKIQLLRKRVKNW